MQHQLSERASHILKTLVHRYIRDGQPIGSRTLTRESGLSLSPATIRNVMADLEDHGYIEAPHTSAGRIPTEKGYRFFVDMLLAVSSPGGGDLGTLGLSLPAGGDSATVLDSATQVLSGLTSMVSVVTLPRHGFGSLKHIEFMPLTERRILAILVFAGNEVQNRVIETDRAYDKDQLQRIANMLNHEFLGGHLSDIRRRLVETMQHEREDMDKLMRAAVDVASKVFAEEAEEDDVIVTGQTNLMEFAELASLDKLKTLFEAFTEKRDLLHLLDRCMDADGIQIYIGQESGYKFFDGCSLVTTNYTVEGEVVGALGVIGPTRMAYDRVIPIVDLTARLLGRALNKNV